MLAIQFRFLYPHYYARDLRDATQVEWPPHPDRVFAALVNAAYASTEPEKYRPLLQWLSRQKPPSLLAPEARPWNDHIRYVPSGINDTGFFEFYSKTAKPENSVTLADLNLYYLWTDVEITQEQDQFFRELLSFVGYLGSTRNMVVAELSSDTLQPNLSPSAFGEYLMRVPHASRLKALEREYQIRIEQGRINYLDPDVAWVYYSHTSSLQKAASLTNTFQRVALFRFAADLDLVRTWDISGMIRDRLLACSQDMLGFVPELIHGHATAGRRYVPHIAFSPRADVNHPRAPGGIKGMALLLPVSSSFEQDQDEIRQVLSHPDLQEFNIGPVQAFLQFHETRQFLPTQESAYAAPSCEWASVTPVMLDYFPGKKTVEEILAVMLEREGISLTGARIQYGKNPYVVGTPPAGRFLLRNAAYYQRPFFHLRLELSKPIRGPFTLGTTRYFGLGHFISLAHS